jgi:transposase
MFTEQFFELLLNFGEEWEVKEVTTNLETNEVDIQVEYFGQGKIYDYAPVRRWRHLDTMQFKTFINCRLPRLKIDGKVKTVEPPWADKYERHSYLFESAVIDLLQATKNQTQTARLRRCPFDVVNRIIHHASSRGMERRKEIQETFENISVDEKSFQKGHSYATILSHPESERVLEVVAGRTLEASRSLIEKAFTDEQRKGVKTISMDLWQAFITMAQEELPEAEIIHDKFHLIKYLNEAIDKVRRREVKEHAQLKESRYALLKNKENLTEKQRLKFEMIRAANYEVSRAWEARENFREIFRNVSLEESEAIFRVWSDAIKESGIQEVMKVEETFANHLRGVLNAMTSELSNAMAERLNGKIQLLKSIARGYRKFENFRSAILFFYGKLSLFPLNSQ